MAATFLDNPPAYVQQLMSEESLAKTGYFDVAEVRRQFGQDGRATDGRRRFFSSMGLATVLATQLWHHQYLGGGLCDLATAGLPAARTPEMAAE